MTTPSQQMPCLVCGTQMAVRIAKGRKSHKPFIMVICPEDGRHFRGFCGDSEFVQRLLALAKE